jgi:hypothetical protein
MTASDLGTPERAKRSKLKPELTGKGYAVRMRVTDGCEIDRLLMAGRITDLEHSTCGALLRDMHDAKLLGCKTAKFEVFIGDKRQAADMQATALQKVIGAMRSIERAHGIPARMMMLAVLLEDRAVRQGSEDMLRNAIAAVEGFYDEWRGSRAVRASLADDIVRAEL